MNDWRSRTQLDGEREPPEYVEPAPEEPPPPLPEPPAAPPAAPIIECEILSPQPNTTLNGTFEAVTVPVIGTARVVSGPGAIGGVEVQIGDGPFKPARSTGPGWSTWDLDPPPEVKTSGALMIVARAVHDGGQATRDRSVRVQTELPPRPPEKDPEPPPDKTPPVVTITSPFPEGALVVDAEGRAELPISGTATDPGGGIQGVEVLVDGVPTTAEQAGGSWANWTAKARVSGAGRHRIEARATDKGGLESRVAVEVVAMKQPPTRPVVERLLLVEKCRLSTFLGAYGAGRIIKTLSLLPSEKTTVNVKSYRRMSETATQSSSILDSHTDEARQEFETTLSSEQANKSTQDESFKWDVQAEASAQWGWGSASIRGGAAGGSNASREELAKNVANAVHKHAAQASAKRDIEVKTSREMRREEGEEFSSESHIENINASRTLNFVFRQMNQKFHTLLHLVDVRVGYVRGDRVTVGGQEEVRYSYREVTLSQLDGLLQMVIVPERRDDVRREIMNILANVFDYRDEPHRMIEEKVLHDASGDAIPNGSYLRVPKGITSSYVDPGTGMEITVPGVILAAMENVMRTDGVVCDAVLGAGDALDGYSKGLQNAAVEARRVENSRQRAALDKEQLAMKLVEQGDSEVARIWKDVYPTPESESLALVTTNPGADGSAGG